MIRFTGSEREHVGGEIRAFVRWHLVAAEAAHGWSSQAISVGAAETFQTIVQSGDAEQNSAAQQGGVAELWQVIASSVRSLFPFFPCKGCKAYYATCCREYQP